MTDGSTKPTLLSAEEALQIVLKVVQRLPPVTVPLHDALGKVLAEDIRAGEPLPAFPASIKVIVSSIPLLLIVWLMGCTDDYNDQDGYAVVASDGPGEYPVVAEARAGSDRIGVAVTPGTVAYVTTGG